MSARLARAARLLTAIAIGAMAASACAKKVPMVVADGPALAYSTTKVMLTRELDMSLASAIEMEALTQALLMRSRDHGEFYAAWSEGRTPAWSGR